MKRSIIIQGKTTSVSLDDELWGELERQAVEEGKSWHDYARQLMFDCPSDVNRSAYLRSAMVRKLRERLDEGRVCPEQPYSSWLVDLRGELNRYNLHLGRILVGRASFNNIELNDPMISKKHVLFCYDGETCWGIDLESKNGTWRNGNRMEKFEMQVGMSIRMGSAELIRLL